jgi:hypothetical protein
MDMKQAEWLLMAHQNWYGIAEKPSMSSIAARSAQILLSLTLPPSGLQHLRAEPFHNNCLLA